MEAHWTNSNTLTQKLPRVLKSCCGPHQHSVELERNNHPQLYVRARNSPPQIQPHQQVKVPQFRYPQIQPFQPMKVPSHRHNQVQPYQTQWAIQLERPQIQPNQPTWTRRCMCYISNDQAATAAYPHTILMVQRHLRTELQVDLSVGHWKQALQSRGLYLPENPPGRDGHESSIRRLRGAMKNHTDAWRHKRPQDNIHWDKHQEYEKMQNVYRIPSMYACRPEHMA